MTEIARWLPDETLFSLCSRVHRVAAHRLPSITCRQLFGHAKAGSAHDFPSRIDDFVLRTGGALGSSNSIIREHTLLSYYLPFLAPARAEAAMEAMRGSSIGALKTQLGLLATRLRANHPLKACPRCMADDRQRDRVAYWHHSHQFPGVWVCAEHGIALLRATVKSTGVERFGWHLPVEEHLEPAACDLSGLPVGVLDVFRAIAEAAPAVARINQSFDVDRLKFVHTYSVRLEERDLALPSGRWRVERVGDEISGFLEQLSASDELAAMALKPTAAVELLRRLLSQTRPLRHPLKIILLTLWAFGSWQTFIDRYRNGAEGTSEASLPGIRSRRGPSPKHRPNPLKARFLELLTVEALAPTTAARQLGIDPATGLAWAAQFGLKCRPRPKKIDGLTRKRLESGLMAGTAKEVLAKKHGISIESVTRVLRTEPGLQQAWHDARREVARKTARRQWSKALGRSSAFGIKAVRSQASGAYAWLYRHDRTWLEEQNLAIARLPKNNHASVDWSSRDLLLRVEIQNAADRLERDIPARRLCLWHLLQVLPDLRPQLRNLDRLPLTEAALRSLLSSTDG